MNQYTTEQWSNVANKAQAPLQELAALNIKTLQSMNYLRAEDLSNIKKPEELVEKQMDIFFKNGHQALEYFQKSFGIIEKAMFGFKEELKQGAEQVKETMENQYHEVKQAQDKIQNQFKNQNQNKDRN